MKLILAVLLVVGSALAQDPDYYAPEGFYWGIATAAYQVEGGWDADGKGENIWDHAIHENPDMVANRDSADVAADSYHHYREDVQLIKAMGLKHYRFSIAWTRIMPNGHADEINQAGIDYYNNLINELLDNDIEPFVTMYHWDLPQALQDELGGWVNRDIIPYFVDYARVLFQNFGDRVKHWMTFNEIKWICEGGYSLGGFAPFIHNEGIGGYQCTHIVLLAHGRTYRMYEEEFKADQNGLIGMAIDSGWSEPTNPDNPDDLEASERDMLMNNGPGWFYHPVVFGNYPQVMIDRIARMSEQEGFPESRLPVFSDEEQNMLKGAFDFMGLNHYSSQLVYLGEDGAGGHPSHWTDTSVVEYVDPSWPPYGEPWGLRNLLVWVRDHYDNPPVIITENGYADDGQHLDDYGRALYHQHYIYAVLTAINEDNCNVFGYTAWSLIDAFEWLGGYSVGLGLNYVDHSDPDRPRTRKYSSYVYENIARTGHVDFNYTPDWPPQQQ